MTTPTDSNQTHQPCNLFTFSAPEGYLSERMICITGASRGIGKALAIECSRLGAQVILLAKDLNRLEKVYDEIIALKQATPAILNIDLEVAGADDHNEIAASIEKEYGRLDGLVHNAGRVGGLTPLHALELST